MISRFFSIFLRQLAEHRAQKGAKMSEKLKNTKKHQVLTEKEIEEILMNNEPDFSSEDDYTDSEILTISIDSNRATESGTSGTKSDTDDEIDGSENIPDDTKDVTIEIIAKTLTWDDISGVSGIEYLTCKLSTKLFLLMIFVCEFNLVIMNDWLELQR